MNFKELQNNFKIRYNTQKTPNCIFSGMPLFLLGDIICNCHYPSLSISLSAGTALIFDISSNFFYVQENNSNLCFSCETDKLSDYHEENFSKAIFKTISKATTNLNISLSGLNMLFSHNTPEKHLSDYISSVLSCLYLTFPSCLPHSPYMTLFSSDLSPLELNRILTSLVSYQNSCVLIDNVSNYQHYLLPFTSKKIIIIKLDTKNQHLSLDIKNAFNSYKKHLSIPTLNYDTLNSDITLKKREKKLLCFTLNEENRIRNYPKISDFTEFCNLIYSSSAELLDLLNDESFKTLADIVSHYTQAFRPMPEDSSMYCIIDNDEIDEFLSFCEKEYEKKAGYKPTFYICDTITSGISKGIIH